MSGDSTPPAPDDWKRRTGWCAECRFDWAEPDYETLVGQCVHAVAVFGEVLSRVDPSEAVEPGLWSPSRYVWHTVDVLRFGTERLWTISADPAFGVPGWDENVIAEVRSYDALSPVVGLIALIAGARAWREAALEAPPDVTTVHSEAGRSAPSTSCSATPTRSAITSGTSNGDFPSPVPVRDETVQTSRSTSCRCACAPRAVLVTRTRRDLTRHTTTAPQLQRDCHLLFSKTAREHAKGVPLGRESVYNRGPPAEAVRPRE